MNKTTKIMSSILAFLLLITGILVPMEAKATKGNKQNITMYVGEAYQYTNFSEVKSVKNSNKKVVISEKDKDSSKHLIIAAKKAGKATITAKTANGPVVINVTVKKPSFEIKVNKISYNELLVTVTNKTKAIFEDAVISYSLKDNAGTEFVKDTARIYSLVPGKNSYRAVSFNHYTFEPDPDKCVIKVEGLSRSPGRVYTEAEKSLKITDKIVSQTDKEVELSINMKNTGKKNISGDVNIVFYDASDNIIGQNNVSVYLKNGAVDTVSRKLYIQMQDKDNMQYATFDHYKIEKAVYTSEYKN